MKPKIGETQALANAQTAASYNTPTYSELQSGYQKGGGTTTPTQVTIAECKAIGLNAITFNWDRQNNLTNWDHDEAQVSSDQSNWYKLRNDGVDWKGTLGAVTPSVSYYITHENIPPGGTEDNPTALTLYYRVRRVTKEPANGDWSAAASATTNLIESKYIKQDAVTSAKLINSAVIAAKIAAGAVLEMALAAGAVTETKIGDDSISTAKLQAAAVIAAKIAAGAVVTEKLSVVALDYINNVTQSGLLNGWGGVTEEGEGSAGNMSIVELAGPDGATAKVLRVTNNGNWHVRTKSFRVNHSKIYRVSVTVKKSAVHGLMYFGLSAFGQSTEGTQNTGNGMGDKLIIPYNTGTRQPGDETSNFYFYSASSPPTAWQTWTTYIIGADRSIDDVPQAKVCSSYAKLKSDTTHVAIRLLNWGNTSSQSMDVFSPVVMEMGAGQIVAENIVAGAVTTAKLAAGSVETAKLAALSVIAAKIAANAVETDKLAANAVETDKLAANAVTAAKITVDALQVQFANVGYTLTVGFSGTGNPDDPDTGDRRLYLDGDELRFERWSGTAWISLLYLGTPLAQIRLGDGIGLYVGDANPMVLHAGSALSNIDKPTGIAGIKIRYADSYIQIENAYIDMIAGGAMRLKATSAGVDITGNLTVSGSAPPPPDASITQAKLKTAQGSVQTTSQTWVNLILPGGEYGFYPQTKTTNSGIGLGAQIVAYIAGNGWTSYRTNIGLKTQLSTYPASAQQRYVTSSGEIHWVFVLRDKINKEVTSVWQAPDHPCFGNGGDPELMPHPFPDLDPETQEIIILNPTTEQVAAIRQGLTRPDGMRDATKDFIEVMLEKFEIDELSTPEWPTEAVTVGLPMDVDPIPGELVQPVKKVIPDLRQQLPIRSVVYRTLKAQKVQAN